jgi:hypothetical protein
MVKHRIALLALSVLASACGEKASTSWVEPAVPSGAKTTVTPESPTTKNIIVGTVMVRQESSEKGVAADVFRLDDSNAQFFFVSVDDSGTSAPRKDCAAGDRFVVTPKTASYYATSPLTCAATLDFELSSVQAMDAVIKQADNLMNAGDFAKAQVYYSLAASRLSYAQPGAARELQNKAHIAAGRALQIEKPTVQVDNDEKFTEETKNKLKAFQSKHRLEQTGVLDTPTQTALAGFSPAEVLKSVRVDHP